MADDECKGDVTPTDDAIFLKARLPVIPDSTTTFSSRLSIGVASL